MGDSTAGTNENKIVYGERISKAKPEVELLGSEDKEGMASGTSVTVNDKAAGSRGSRRRRVEHSLMKTYFVVEESKWWGKSSSPWVESLRSASEVGLWTDI
jgi:hypothetical protein